MNYELKKLLCMALMLLAMVPAMKAEDFSAKEVVLEHIKDSHDWHVTDLGEGKSLVIPLPIIVNSSTGWHVFCSSQFEHHADVASAERGEAVEEGAPLVADHGRGLVVQSLFLRGGEGVEQTGLVW